MGAKGTKHTPKGNVRLAFKGNKVVEAKKLPPPKESAANRKPTGLDRLMS